MQFRRRDTSSSLSSEVVDTECREATSLPQSAPRHAQNADVAAPVVMCVMHACALARWPYNILDCSSGILLADLDSQYNATHRSVWLVLPGVVRAISPGREKDEGLQESRDVSRRRRSSV